MDGPGYFLSHAKRPGDWLLGQASQGKWLVTGKPGTQAC